MQSLQLSSSQMLTIGIIASITVGIGEYLLHFLPGGPGGEVSMLESVPLERASYGHFFVVFGAPLYFAGYYGLKRMFQTTNQFLARLIFISGVLSFSIGGVWVASRYFGAVVLQKSLGTEDHAYYLTAYEDHYQILVWALRILVAIISVVYVILILKNKEGFPKWLAFFNPIVLLVIIISTLAWIKPVGIHIAPIAMNVTHLIFFSLLLWQLNLTQNKSNISNNTKQQKE